MIPDFIETEIEILEVLTPRTARAALPNQKIVIAFYPDGGAPAPVQPGRKVRARIHLSDFSRALILGPIEA